MPGACGIEIDGDNLFITLAAKKNNRIHFLQEYSFSHNNKGDGFLLLLKKNIENIHKLIKEKEKKFSLTVRDIFLILPFYLYTLKKAEETIVFKGKRIEASKIKRARETIENVNVNWDEVCLHQIIANYEIDGILYDHIPDKKYVRYLKLHSLLFIMKKSVYKEIEDVFYNCDINLKKCIAEEIGTIFSCFDNRSLGKNIVVKISLSQSNIVGYNKGHFIRRRISFGINDIIKGIEKKFSSPSVGEDIFRRHFTFLDDSALGEQKQIVLKNEGTYFTISTAQLCSFVKTYLKDNISSFLLSLPEEFLKDATISFLTIFNKYRGFFDFLKSFLSYPIKKTNFISSSSGALNYGYFSLWEEIPQIRRLSLLQKALRAYEEYF